MEERNGTAGDTERKALPPDCERSAHDGIARQSEHRQGSRVAGPEAG
jgi:hypothetical protein